MHADELLMFSFTRFGSPNCEYKNTILLPPLMLLLLLIASQKCLNSIYFRLFDSARCYLITFYYDNKWKFHTTFFKCTQTLATVNVIDGSLWYNRFGIFYCYKLLKSGAKKVKKVSRSDIMFQFEKEFILCTKTFHKISWKFDTAN